MLSRVLYRHVFPTDSQASHPSKSSTHTNIAESSNQSLSNRKRNLPDDQERNDSHPECHSSESSPNNLDKSNVNTKEKELSLGPIDPNPENVQSDNISDTPVKVSLGEITEVKGVIFDMDGTLTIPVLNFMEMKRRIGLNPTDDILPTVQKLPPKEREEAMAIIEDFEEEGVRNMKVSVTCILGRVVGQLIPTCIYYTCTINFGDIELRSIPTLYMYMYLQPSTCSKNLSRNIK